MEEDTDTDSIDYPDEPENGKEDDDEDPKEDPSDDTYDKEEEHLASADSSVVPIIDPVPSARDTEAFETNESAPTPSLSQTRAPLGHRAAMIGMRDDILEEDMPPRRRFVLTTPPPGCDVAESSVADAARVPRGQYDFIDAVEAGQGLIRSLGHDARTIARVVDRAEDVGYFRALQASEHRMMTSTEEVNLRVSYQAHVYRKEMRGQRTAYEIELHEVRQAYLSSEAQNRALLVRLETLETHISRMKWQQQRAEDDAVKQIMRTQVLEDRVRIDTVEDTS
ncbi:hypothetical protein Tco_1537765, partial [Tanacetum coccineum]